MMRILLAGATGAIGRPLVARLVAAGHEVYGTTRVIAKAAWLRELGATPVVCDALDPANVARAMEGAEPEVVVNQLTDLPRTLDPKTFREYYPRNDRLRREATRHLIEAAQRVGARRFVQQSVAFWYAPTGNGPKPEEAPLWIDAPEPLGPSVRTIRECEAAVLGSGMEGVVARYGFLYGPGTWYASDGDVVRQLRARKYPMVGGGKGIASFIHVDDAAEATVALIERGSPGVYNVVDDEPAPAASWMPALAEAVGAKPPRNVPRLLAALAVGRGIATWMATMRGASNANLRRELGWKPRFASWRQGFAEGLG